MKLRATCYMHSTDMHVLSVALLLSTFIIIQDKNIYVNSFFWYLLVMHKGKCLFLYIVQGKRGGEVQGVVVRRFAPLPLAPRLRIARGPNFLTNVRLFFKFILSVYDSENPERFSDFPIMSAWNADKAIIAK